MAPTSTGLSESARRQHAPTFSEFEWRRFSATQLGRHSLLPVAHIWSGQLRGKDADFRRSGVTSADRLPSWIEIIPS